MSARVDAERLNRLELVTDAARAHRRDLRYLRDERAARFELVLPHL